MSIDLRPRPETAARVARVAQGLEPADVVVSGGALVDVFTAEILEGWGLAVVEDRVAFVGPDQEVLARCGPDTERVDLDGDLASPGLVEGHTHLTRISLADLADAQLRAGVTTTIVESMELAVVTGAAGTRALLEVARTMPGRLFFTISGLIVCDPERDRQLDAYDWASLLDHPRVAGLGEAYWADLLRGHRRTLDLIAAALARGLPAEGHGAGARPASLNALAAFGISSDHEGIAAEEVRLRLRLGLRTMARHGATRQDLAAIAPVWQAQGLDWSRLEFVTDGLEPEAMATADSLNRVVEQAVELGMPLPAAIRSASHNVAEHFGLGRWLGGLGPGMLADLVVIPRGGGFRPRLVLVGGRRPAPAPAATYPDWMLDTVHLDGIAPELLTHPGPGVWRAIEQVAPLVTRETSSDGSDALVCTVLERLGSGRGFRGLWKGFGLRGGAVALSSAWESPGLVIAGDTPSDMAVAARRVADLRGGAAVVSRGRVLAEWAAPVAGLYSTAPLGQVVEEVAAVNAALRSLGVTWENPILTVEVLTTAAIPFIRIWSGGYRRLRDGSVVGLEWRER